MKTPAARPAARCGEWILIDSIGIEINQRVMKAFIILRLLVRMRYGARLPLELSILALLLLMYKILQFHGN